MPETEQERQTYTVTPGPAVLAKMGQSWTLFVNDAPAATFSRSDLHDLDWHIEHRRSVWDAQLILTATQAAALVADGYEVEGEKLPEPAVDPIPPDEAAFLEEAGDPVPDAGPGIDPIGPPQDIPGEAAVPPGSDALKGIEEEMDGEPGEGVQLGGGTDAHGHPAEPVKTRKR